MKPTNINSSAKFKIINLNQCSLSKAKEYLQTYFYGWAALEQWNPGKHDMLLYFNAYKEAFFVLEVQTSKDAEYEPAAIMFAPYDADTNQASIGLYISEKNKYRGKGYGYRLWKHVFTTLDNINSSNIKYLYGVPTQVKNYEKSGYHATHKIIHYTMNASQKYGPFQTIITAYNSNKAPKQAVIDFLTTNYSSGFARFVAAGAEKEDININLALDRKSEKIIGVGISRPLHNESSYRYAIVTERNRFDAADDLFRALNRNLMVEEEVVIDVRDNTWSQQTYEYYCQIDGSPKDTTYGQHWTTEMTTNKTTFFNERLNTNAEPSLETNFLRHTSVN